MIDRIADVVSLGVSKAIPSHTTDRVFSIGVDVCEEAFGIIDRQVKADAVNQAVCTNMAELRSLASVIEDGGSAEGFVDVAECDCRHWFGQENREIAEYYFLDQVR